MNTPLRDFNRTLDNHLPPACKWLLVLNVGIFMADALLHHRLAVHGLLFPLRYGFKPWGPVTYMFLHKDVTHLLCNMLGLWFFGPPLEERWGTRRFLQFYFAVGIGAGLFNILLGAILPYYFQPAIGASGVIMGMILVLTAYDPNGSAVLFIIPMPLKVLLLITVIFSILGLLANNDGISHSTHLCGLVAAYIWMTIYHRDWDFKTWRWR